MKPAFALANVALAICVLAYGQPGTVKDPGYKYVRLGKASDASPRPSAGYLLAGGGDVDRGIAWLCQKANGGDLLVLRDAADDAYNGYIHRVCPALNSVATLAVTGREGARAEFVVQAVRHAEAIFIAGGDQAQYIDSWQGSPLQDEINAAVARGVPMGGAAAGLNMLSEFVDTAAGGAVTSAQALADPFDDRITLARHFLKIPLLGGTLTDAHFAQHDAMGRDLALLARLVAQGWTPEPHGVFVDDKTAVLIETGGKVSVLGSGAAYFVRLTKRAGDCNPGDPLTLHGAEVYRASEGGSFDLLRWSGTGGVGYSVSVENGVLKSAQAGGAIY
jgi:cyanophycinase